MITLIVAAYALSLLPLLMFGSEGMLWIVILGISGLPMLVLAIIGGWICAEQIVAAPWRWSTGAGLAAILIAAIGLGLLTGDLRLGLFGLPVALFAPLGFVALLKIFTPAAPPAGS
ncbi:MAG TPA: hypothetical protein PKN09_04175 [Novosphingobium sp.]|nr:hypothetical protein [Novosphingobium sp.]